jgi:hypothetical protein
MQGGKIILMSDSCSSASGAARDMIHVLEYKGIDVSSLLSEREKRQRKKTSSKFLADIDVGLSCVEFISAHSCPKCGYYVADFESDEKVYSGTAMFGRCEDPVEPHYVVHLELVCKNCKAIRTILKYGPDEGVRVTLRN